MTTTTYILLNKDTEIMSFDIVEQDSFINYENIQIKGKLPITMRSIGDWIKDRYVIMERNRSDSLMESLGLTDDKSRIEFTNCVSLFDSFWIKRQDNPLIWNDVSLYRNDFSQYLSRFTMDEDIDINAPKKKRHLSPEYHSEGSFDRCWIWSSKGICMLKAGSRGYANSGREPFSEVYTTQIEKALNYKHYVDYELLWYPRRIAGSKKLVNSLVTSCQIMTNENVGLITASKLGINSYEELIDYCAKISEEEKEKVIDLLILDCITFNPDRHMSNVSMYIENETQKVLGVSKIYDNNMALAPYYMPEYDESLYCYCSELITKLGMEFDDLFLLCYESSSRKTAIRKQLRSFISDFHFTYLPEDEVLFPKSRLVELETVLKKQVSHYLDITRPLLNSKKDSLLPETLAPKITR